MFRVSNIKNTVYLSTNRHFLKTSNESVFVSISFFRYSKVSHHSTESPLLPLISRYNFEVRHVVVSQKPPRDEIDRLISRVEQASCHLYNIYNKRTVPACRRADGLKMHEWGFKEGVCLAVVPAEKVLVSLRHLLHACTVGRRLKFQSVLVRLSHLARSVIIGGDTRGISSRPNINNSQTLSGVGIIIVAGRYVCV